MLRLWSQFVPNMSTTSVQTESSTSSPSRMTITNPNLFPVLLLRVAKSLHDYAGRTFTLEVEARDSGTPLKSVTTEVIIHVLETHNSSYLPTGAAPRALMEARWEQKFGYFQLVSFLLSVLLNNVFIALK